jgi:ABC-type protease/lipase transport system fused ATPase/permease subunit
VGYLGQEAVLFDGTVFENVSRFAPNPDHEAALAAINRAGALELILSLPDGLNTPVGIGGAQLSGGQRQRIALAPLLLRRSARLRLRRAERQPRFPWRAGAAIDDLKKRGKVVIVIAHRPSAIMLCDTLLMIQNGRQIDYGAREDVLRRSVQNYPRAVPQPAAAAVGGER